jgi:hypothetical protein
MNNATKVLSKLGYTTFIIAARKQMIRLTIKEQVAKPTDDA